MKPEIRKVQLKPEEAVLGACKTTANVGPVALNCSLVGDCNTLGS